MTVTACGTYGGYQAHARRGEAPCEACRVANRNYTRRLRAFRPDIRQTDRWSSRTRYRALERLAKEYPARLAEILDEERAKDPDPRLAHFRDVAGAS